MLMSNPTEQHLKMVEREWRRKNVHRDVRICILLEAFRVLEDDCPNEALLETAWRIIENCVVNPDTKNNEEVLIALIGCFNSRTSLYTSIAFKPRTLQNLETFKEVSLETEQRERLRNKVLLKLALRIYDWRRPPQVEDERIVRDRLEIWYRRARRTKSTRELNVDGDDDEPEEEEEEEKEMKGDVVMLNLNESTDTAEAPKLVEAEVVGTKCDENGEYVILRYNDNEEVALKRYSPRIVITDLTVKRCLTESDIPYLALKCVVDTLGKYYAVSSTRDEEDSGSEYFKTKITGMAMKMITNFEADWLYHPKKDIHKVHEARYKMAVEVLLRISGCYQSWGDCVTYDEERLSLIGLALHKFFDRMEACSVDESELYAALSSRVKVLLNSLSEKTPKRVLDVLVKGVTTRCPLNLRNHFLARYCKLTRKGMGFYDDGFKLVEYFEKEFEQRIQLMVRTAIDHPFYVKHIIKGIERILYYVTQYGSAICYYGGNTFNITQRPWKLITSILDRTFLHEFESEAPGLVMNVRHRALYHILNDMYANVWSESLSLKSHNNLANLWCDAHLYMMRHITDILPKIGESPNVSAWHSSLKSKFKNQIWSIWNERRRSYVRMMYKTSLSDWDEYARKCYTPEDYPKKKNLYLISDFLEKLLEMNREMNGKEVVTRSMRQVYDMTYQFIQKFAVPLRITFGHDLLPWVRVLVRAWQQNTKGKDRVPNSIGFSGAADIWKISKKAMSNPNFDESYRRGTAKSKNLSRAERRALQFKPITPEVDEYPFTILNVEEVDEVCWCWETLKRKVFESEPLKTLLYLRLDPNGTVDGDDDEKYDEDYHHQRCLELISLYTDKIQREKYKNPKFFSWTPFMSIWSSIRADNVGSRYERKMAAKRLKAIFRKIFADAASDNESSDFYRYLATDLVMNHTRCVVDFVAKEGDEYQAGNWLDHLDDEFLNKMWSETIMDYVLNKSEHHNKPNVASVLASIHSITKMAVFKRTKHEKDVHSFLEGIISPMVASYIANCEVAYDQLSALQSVERLTVSTLITKYSGIEAVDSPRSLGQYILDENRLEIVRASMAIQSTVTVLNYPNNFRFESSIMFKSNLQSTTGKDNIVVNQLKAALKYNVKGKSRSVQKSVVSVVEYVIQNVLNRRKLSDGPLDETVERSTFEMVLFEWLSQRDLVGILCRILTNRQTQIESFTWELLFEWMLVWAQKFQSPNLVAKTIQDLLREISPNHDENRKTSEEAQRFLKFVIATASDTEMHSEFRKTCYLVVREFRTKIELISYFCPEAFRAIIDGEMYLNAVEHSGYSKYGCNISESILKVHRYEKALKEEERKEAAYLKKRYGADTMDYDSSSDDDEKKKDENPKQEGKGEDEDDEETVKKMMAKYVGPITMELVTYYLSLQTLTDGLCDMEMLSDFGLYQVIKDQWKMVRDSIPGLVYQRKLMQNLMVSSFVVISRFPQKWSVVPGENPSSLCEIPDLDELEKDGIYDFAVDAVELMTLSKNEWSKNPTMKLMEATPLEMQRARFLQQWHAITFMVRAAADEAERQLPFEVKQYETNGVVFENHETVCNGEAIILDSISMDFKRVRNVVVTMDQLKFMKELKEDELVTADRLPARMKLENQPFTWLPKWMEMLAKLKELCAEDERVLIDVSILKQVITEYKSDDERQQRLEDFYDILDLSVWSF